MYTASENQFVYKLTCNQLSLRRVPLVNIMKQKSCQSIKGIEMDHFSVDIKILCGSGLASKDTFGKNSSTIKTLISYIFHIDKVKVIPT